MEAPFDRSDWLIYACSPDNFFGEKLPRVDQWFEVHKPITHETRRYPYLRWLEDVPLVWMRDKEAMPYFKGAVAYPEKEMKEKFGPYLFTSSIAFILAKAIADCEAMGIKRLGLWGILQMSKPEFVMQRTGTQHMLWIASRLGIEIVLPKEARQLLDPPPEVW